MNILFPVAGLGTRFSNKGYTEPKPFIKIKNKYIIEYALSSLKVKGNYYVISRPLDIKYKEILYSLFTKYNINGELITISEKTSGAAETCLHMEGLIEGDEELIITNCDQFTPNWNYNGFIQKSKDWDGLVTTYPHKDIEPGKQSKYSFVKLDKDNKAIAFAEKFAFSPYALNGIHYWKQASYFFNSARKLINDKSNLGEKYISLTYNIIVDDYRVGIYPMNEGEFYSLGSPEEIEMNLEFIK